MKPRFGYQPPKKIIRNSAHCESCDTEIVSEHRHDWVSCPCGDIFVDGGKDYIRRGFKDGASYTDTSIYEEEAS